MYNEYNIKKVDIMKKLKDNNLKEAAKCFDEAMEEYYYNITKGGFYIPDRIKEGYMEEDYDNLSNQDIEL